MKFLARKPASRLRFLFITRIRVGFKLDHLLHRAHEDVTYLDVLGGRQDMENSVGDIFCVQGSKLILVP